MQGSQQHATLGQTATMGQVAGFATNKATTTAAPSAVMDALNRLGGSQIETANMLSALESRLDDALCTNPAAENPCSPMQPASSRLAVEVENAISRDFYMRQRIASLLERLTV